MKEHPVKRTLAFIGSMMAIAALAGSPVVVAQEKSALVPLKVQLVVSRHNGDKKISSLPYTLWITANSKGTTSVRMGVQVPIVQTVFGAAAAGAQTTTPMSSYSYKDIGTNIDCSATSQADGTFSLDIKLNDSSVSFDSKDPNQTLKGVPAFRNFTSNFSILVKDGQTAQYASATDPLSGETLKVDVTINVLK
jgi:hypothetical protein